MPGIGVGIGLKFEYDSGAAPFSPASLSPFAWYEVAPANMWQDTAGTVPVTAANDPVARVDDLSGNGRHLLQSNATARPLYKTGGGLIFSSSLSNPNIALCRTYLGAKAGLSL